MGRKFYYSSISLSLFVILMTSIAFSHESGKVSPILNNAILKGFYLHKLDYDNWKISDITDSDIRYYEKQGIDLKALMNDKIEQITEYWLTVSREELKREKKKHKGKVWKIDGENWKNRISVEVNRYFLKNAELAQYFAQKKAFDHYNLKEGSFSGKKLGDRCWTNRDKFGKNKDYALILILKNNVLAEIKIMRPRGKEIDTDFIRKVEREAASRL